MTPLEAQIESARIIHTAHTAAAGTDDLARAVGDLVGAAVRCGQAWRTAAASWLRILGVGR